MKHSYSQFCPLARAAEALCERWTPLLVRELLCGSRRFNDLHRGLPRMSSSLLAQRLRQLEQSGIVTRSHDGKASEYLLTPAGHELGPIIDALWQWGARWGGAPLRSDELDAGLLMWNMRRSLVLAATLHDAQVLHVHFPDAAVGERDWWLTAADGTVALFDASPGRAAILQMQASLHAMTAIWHGDYPVSDALAQRALTLTGPAADVDRLRQWLERFADGSAAHGWPGVSMVPLQAVPDFRQ